MKAIPLHHGPYFLIENDSQILGKAFFFALGQIQLTLVIQVYILLCKISMQFTSILHYRS